MILTLLLIISSHIVITLSVGLIRYPNLPVFIIRCSELVLSSRPYELVQSMFVSLRVVVQLLFCRVVRHTGMIILVIIVALGLTRMIHAELGRFGLAS